MGRGLELHLPDPVQPDGGGRGGWARLVGGQPLQTTGRPHLRPGLGVEVEDLAQSYEVLPGHVARVVSVQLEEDVPQVLVEVVGEKVGAGVGGQLTSPAVEPSEVSGQGGVKQTTGLALASEEVLLSPGDTWLVFLTGRGGGLAGVLTGQAAARHEGVVPGVSSHLTDVQL